MFQQSAESPEAIEKLSLKGMTASDNMCINYRWMPNSVSEGASLNTLSFPSKKLGVSGGQKNEKTLVQFLNYAGVFSFDRVSDLMKLSIS